MMQPSLQKCTLLTVWFISDASAVVKMLGWRRGRRGQCWSVSPQSRPPNICIDSFGHRSIFREVAVKHFNRSDAFLDILEVDALPAGIQKAVE